MNDDATNGLVGELSGARDGWSQRGNSVAAVA
jgi:hypothetical protein